MRVTRCPLGWVLAPLVALAACGNDHVLIELSGTAAGATDVEVVLLEPLVLAKIQRQNDRNAAPSNAPERVFYVAQRSSVRFPLGDQSLDGLQFEIDGSQGAYLPLVVVRNGQGLIAAGIYNPASVFAAKVGVDHVPDAVAPVSDVTIYPIQLEPAKGFGASPGTPALVGKGEVMVVPCGQTGGASGAVWRRLDGNQLRVLLPLEDDTSGSAVDRLSAPDLDCDEHSAGPAGLARDVGDQLDCDDTAFIVHAGARELCSQIDEDCNPTTTASAVPCNCATTGGTCICVDPGGTSECPITGRVQGCMVPAHNTATGPAPCDSAGALAQIPECMTAACVVMISSVPPGWDVKIGSDQGVGAPVNLPAGAPLRIAVRGTLTPPPFGGSNVLVLSVKAGTATTLSNHAVKLTPVGAGDACSGNATIMCTQ